MTVPVDIKGSSQDSWSHLREAIHHRFPQISESELHSLHSLHQNSDELINAVCQRTGADREDVEAVVRQAESFANRVSHAAEAAVERARTAMEPVGQRLRSGYATVNRNLEQHPTGASGIAFVTGFTLGVLVTLAVVHSRPEPTVMDAIRHRRWH